MIRTLTALLALVAVAAPAAAVERRYPVIDFDRVQVDGPYQVSLATGIASSAKVAGSQRAIDRISIEIRGRTLHIRANSSAWGGYPGEAIGTATVQLSTRDLKAATVNGAGGLAIDKIRGLRVDLSVGGAGTLAVAAADTDQLVASLVGSGRIKLAGRTRMLRASIQGTGDLDAGSLRSENLDLQAQSAGAITAAAIQTAKVTATGLGQVTIGGSPACTVSGPAAGQVVCGN